MAAEAKKGGGESCSPSTHPPSSQLGNGTGGREERRRDVRLLLRSTAVVKRLVHGEAQRRKRTSFLQYIHTLCKNNPHSCFFQSVFSIGTHYSSRRMLTFALPYFSFLSSSAEKAHLASTLSWEKLGGVRRKAAMDLYSRCVSRH